MGKKERNISDWECPWSIQIMLNMTWNSESENLQEITRSGCRKDYRGHWNEKEKQKNKNNNLKIKTKKGKEMKTKEGIRNSSRGVVFLSWEYSYSKKQKTKEAWNGSVMVRMLFELLWELDEKIRWLYCWVWERRLKEMKRFPDSLALHFPLPFSLFFVQLWRQLFSRQCLKCLLYTEINMPHKNKIEEEYRKKSEKKSTSVREETEKSERVEAIDEKDRILQNVEHVHCTHFLIE